MREGRPGQVFVTPRVGSTALCALHVLLLALAVPCPEAVKTVVELIYRTLVQLGCATTADARKPSPVECQEGKSTTHPSREPVLPKVPPPLRVCLNITKPVVSRSAPMQLRGTRPVYFSFFLSRCERSKSVALVDPCRFLPPGSDGSCPRQTHGRLHEKKRRHSRRIGSPREDTQHRDFGVPCRRAINGQGFVSRSPKTGLPKRTHSVCVCVGSIFIFGFIAIARKLVCG